ncbi:MULTISPECIES: hypothetical protein [Arthrobacter]|uniref:Uncharacterized protein n=1 Tax=Arthrobacter sunyaminii TaxID=2816859 RepID=A0A975XKL1_9MICC|nr:MULTISPECIES: hypothetical protein [Arthrobacter]MBO0896819.1 hypothetical protein [Arthrobacter sunyaminii]MBO0909302.1 hypothetical protein [Arthrobacter sunyaminii]QWQ36367.1 hypothetical protein KG104_00510 [Arthrobacter sunyaminii]
MEYVEVLLPSICVGALFYFVMKALLNVDRSERKALAEAEREADLAADRDTSSGTPEKESN